MRYRRLPQKELEELVIRMNKKQYAPALGSLAFFRTEAQLHELAHVLAADAKPEEIVNAFFTVNFFDSWVGMHIPRDSYTAGDPNEILALAATHIYLRTNPRYSVDALAKVVRSNGNLRASCYTKARFIKRSILSMAQTDKAKTVAAGLYPLLIQIRDDPRLPR